MLAATILTASSTTAVASHTAAADSPPSVRTLRAKIVHNRSLAVHRGIWLGILLHHGHGERRTDSPVVLEALLHRWKHRAVVYEAVLRKRSQVYAELLCIHRGEGSWTALSTAGPYYGGLQMDRPFMLAFGARFVSRFGDARHWKPGLQVAVGYRAVRRVGFTPWPATGAACGV